MRKRNNPSVRLVPRLPPPLAQGRLSRKRFSRSDEEGKKCAPQPKNLPRGRKIGCFFCRFPVKYCLHLFGCIRDARLLHPCVPLLCRDGGAAERARFEIVLGSDVYQGSNPCLCATENGVDFGRLRFTLHEYDRDLRVEAFAGANGLRANCLLTNQLGAN